MSASIAINPFYVYTKIVSCIAYCAGESNRRCCQGREPSWLDEHRKVLYV